MFYTHKKANLTTLEEKRVIFQALKAMVESDVLYSTSVLPVLRPFVKPFSERSPSRRTMAQWTPANTVTSEAMREDSFLLKRINPMRIAARTQMIGVMLVVSVLSPGSSYFSPL